jgi:site-specific DNA recombinase
VKKSSRRERDKEDWISYPVPPLLLDDGTFEKAQELLEENKRRKAKNRKSVYLASGLTWCGCGHRRVGDAGGNGNRYYRCAQRVYKHPKPSECTIPGVNAEAMDKMLWEQVKKAMSDPATLRESVELNVEERKHGDQFLKEAHELKQLIKKTAVEQDRYARAYGAGDMPLEQFKRFTFDVKRRQKAYQQQLDHLMAESKQPAAENTDQLCEMASRVLKRMADQDKELLISHAVKKVIVYREGVELQIHIPLPSSTLSVKVPYRAKSRNCRAAERRQIDAV